MEPMKVTSIDDLKRYSEGAIVELPAFGEGQPFFARLGRPSMMKLMKDGKIPNSLIKQANSLFEHGSASFDTKSESAMADLFELLDVICDSVFLEPTYSQLKAAGVQLTDAQYMFVFTYMQQGVRALESFR